MRLVLNTVAVEPDDRPWIQVLEDEGRHALLVNGAVQSISVGEAPPRRNQPHGYWSAMLPDIVPRRALVLGYGGGTLATLLRHRFPEVSIVGVDLEPGLARVGREYLGLDPGEVELVRADAITYVTECRERFDFVAVDLFRGHHPEARCFGTTFLRHLRRILEPGGRASFNVFEDSLLEERASRIDAVLPIARRTPVSGNVILLCVARRRRRAGASAPPVMSER